MRILIANPFGIGDVLFSFPLVHALREQKKDAFVGYLCNRRTEELVANEKAIDWHIVYEKDEFREKWKQSTWEGIQFLQSLFGEVRRQRFDLLIDLSLGWQISFGALLAGIPRGVGFHFRGRGRFLTDRLPIKGFHDRPVAEYYLSLLSLVSLSSSFEEKVVVHLPISTSAEAACYISSLGAVQGKPIIGLVPGGGASWGPYAHYKQWPAESFAELANTLSERHNAQILLIGDSQEEALCRKIGNLCRSSPLYAIQVPSLLLLGGILKSCDCVVGNDSGAMHIASSVGAKTLTIFGPVDESVYGPFPHQAHQRVVSKTLSCRPCYQAFRLPPCPWGNACLKQLEVSQVLQAAEELL